MLLELYMLIQITAIVCFAIGFFMRDEYFWALTMVLTAVLIFASYDIAQNVNVVTNMTTSGSFTAYGNMIVTQHNTDKTLSYLNLGVFLLSLALFLNDIFINFKNKNLADRGG